MSYRTLFAEAAPAASRTIPRLVATLAVTMLAAAPAHSTIMFRPTGRPPEVFAYGGKTVSQPLTGTDALNSPRVYVIFLGPNFEEGGKPTAAVNSMLNGLKAILSSSYLSQLTQYGSDGKATYAGYTIDTGTDPSLSPKTNYMYSETDTILSESKFASWLPPSGGDARKAPIYIVARYTNSGTNVSGDFGGSNNSGPNSYSKNAVNFIDAAITSADQVDEFTWIVSHELVERISTGTGSLIGIGPSAGNQICDGEPEGGDFYAQRLPVKYSPLVTSYWSVIDQAYIIPDGKLDRVLMVPVWNKSGSNGNFVSLQQGNLYLITGYAQQGATEFVSTTTKIDSKVQFFVVNLTGGTAQIFDLTSDGQVKQYSGTAETWTTVSESGTVASMLVTSTWLSPVGDGTYTLADGFVYILADKKVYQYTGSGTSWNVTLSNVTDTAVAAADGDLYQLAGSDGLEQTVYVRLYPTSGGRISASDQGVQSIVTVSGVLYMLAVSPEHPLPGVFSFDSYNSKWTAVTDPATMVYSIAAAGDELCMLATGPGVSGAIGVAEYSLSSDTWIPLTGSNTAVAQILVQDGAQLYIVAANGNNGPFQVWQYTAPGNFTDLTGTNTNVKSASIGTDNSLNMIATENSSKAENFVYNGKPLSWTQK